MSLSRVDSDNYVSAQSSCAGLISHYLVGHTVEPKAPVGISEEELLLQHRQLGLVTI